MKPEDLLKELTNGNYCRKSKKQSKLFESFHNSVIELTQQEYLEFSEKICNIIPDLFSLRNSRKISYSILTDIIISCMKKDDYKIYNYLETYVLTEVNKNKIYNFWEFITLCNVKNKLFGNIDDLEDFYIKKYLEKSRFQTINSRFLIDFSLNVKCNKRKILDYIVAQKPFANEYVIRRFIELNDELSKFALLL